MVAAEQWWFGGFMKHNNTSRSVLLLRFTFATKHTQHYLDTDSLTLVQHTFLHIGFTILMTYNAIFNYTNYNSVFSPWCIEFWGQVRQQFSSLPFNAFDSSASGKFLLFQPLGRALVQKLRNILFCNFSLLLNQTFSSRMTLLFQIFRIQTQGLL